MERDSYVVIGKYNDQTEVRETLETLKREGYAREDISLYSNRRDTHDPFEDTLDLETRATEDMATVKEDEDRSIWDDFKDMFSTDDDHDTDTTTDDDFLAPHREDIRKGYTVIAVRNYRGDTEVRHNTTDRNVDPLGEDLREPDARVDVDRDVPDGPITHDPTDTIENDRFL